MVFWIKVDAAVESIPRLLRDLVHDERQLGFDAYYMVFYHIARYKLLSPDALLDAVMDALVDELQKLPGEVGRARYDVIVAMLRDTLLYPRAHVEGFDAAFRRQADERWVQYQCRVGGEAYRAAKAEFDSVVLL